MSVAREKFRQVISRDSCTLAANIFDPLSARIAHLLEYEVCVLSGSVGKVANLGVPDIVMSNMSDVVDHCRRITRIADVSLMVDAEDGFGNAVNVVRTVREMEAAGVAAIEIEDNFVPRQFNVQDPGLVSKEEQAGKLKAAVDARTDPTTVIVARSAAFGLCPPGRGSRPPWGIFADRCRGSDADRRDEPGAARGGPPGDVIAPLHIEPACRCQRGRDLPGGQWRADTDGR